MNNLLPENFFFNHYFKLVMRLECITPSSYAENHHIYPRAIFGESGATVRVSYRHHIVLHYLFWRGCQVAYGNDHLYTEKAKRAVYSMKIRIGSHRQKLDQLELAKKACRGENFRHSAETKQRISNAMKGRPCPNSKFLHSKEAIAKGAQTRSGLGSAVRRPVKNLDTGEVFPVMRWAALKYNISQTGILAACKGLQKTSAGCRWEFA